ncbi:MAG: hypothetical protein PVJ03_03985 [Chromatiaceae bacterium]|jgi:hypothetical protein
MKPNRKTSFTRLHDLEGHIRRLADRPADDGPVLSCHLDLTRGVAACRRYISDQASNLRSGLRGKARRDFERGLSVLLERLAPPPGPRAGGLSLFVAVRGNPEVLASLFFAVPVGDRMSLTATPDIFPLLSLKDRLESHMLVLVQPEWLQIAEVNLGDVSVKAWAAHATSAAVRHGVAASNGPVEQGATAAAGMGRHIHLVERVLQAAGRSYLFLAGDPKLCEEVYGLLAPSYRARLVETLPLPASHTLKQAAEVSIAAFEEFESGVSEATAARLLRGVGVQGSAVAGAAATLSAMRERRADTLVMSRDFAASSGWVCNRCGDGHPKAKAPDICPSCGDPRVAPLDLRLELIRLAGQQGLPVELVDGDALRYLGGVGCLLRNSPETRAAPLPRRFGTLDLVA